MIDIPDCSLHMQVSVRQHPNTKRTDLLAIRLIRSRETAVSSSPLHLLESKSRVGG